MKVFFWHTLNTRYKLCLPYSKANSRVDVETKTTRILIQINGMLNDEQKEYKNLSINDGPKGWAFNKTKGSNPSDHIMI